MTECMKSRKSSENHRCYFFLNCRDAKLKFIWTTNYESQSKGNLADGYLNQQDFSNIAHQGSIKKNPVLPF